MLRKSAAVQEYAAAVRWPKLVFALVIVAVWLASGLYRVQPNQQGIPMVFGEFTGVPQEAGLHWNWPSPIGQVFRPDVTRENRIEAVPIRRRR